MGEEGEDIIRTDVCIVGAGPAGVAASIRLSQAGIRHIIADAAEFPRHKPCGDIITSGVLRALGRLDSGLAEELKARKIFNPIWHSLIYPGGKSAISLDFLPFNGKEGEAGCYSVSRYELDAALLEKVRGSSMADFREGCRVKSMEDRKEGKLLRTEEGTLILAGIVILATGSGSQLPARAGMPVPDEDCAVGIRFHYENVDWNPQHTALFLNAGSMPGGLYLTPLPGGKCNVNLVLSMRKVKKEKAVLRESLENMLESNPVLKKAFAHARRCGQPEGSRLFLGLRQRPVSANRLLLAGDAAGLIEFFSGNGIPQAYGSGILAAEMAVKALQSGDCSADFLRNYDRALQQKFRPGGFPARMVFNMLHHPLAGKLLVDFLAFLSDRPQTNALLRNLLYHKKPLAVLLNPRFWYRLLFQKKRENNMTSEQESGSLLQNRPESVLV